jgi:succinate dehydrogenase/fumarate reductase flavoprotein subunit
METKVIDTDVLILGGSSAGLWAAIRATDFCPNVTLVDKGIVASAGISTFIHVVSAPVPEEELKPALKEIVERSTYLTDQTRVEILLREMGDRFREMEQWGVPFERDSSGKIITVKRMGQKFTSCVFINGRPMMETLKQQALERGVKLVERVMATDLLTSDGLHPTQGQVVGAVGFHTITGEPHHFRAKAVILASGLIGGKLHVMYTDGVTGDGQAIAFRAGAELQNMELVTNPVFPIWERKFCTGGQGEYMSAGARVVNKEGEDIIPKYAPDKTAPFLTRIQLCQAAAKEVVEGHGPVYFDMRHLTDENVEMMRRVLPSAMKAFDEEGIDLQKQRVEITPIVPYMAAGGEGGIRISPNSATNIPGLYAAGSASFNGGNHSYIIGLAQSYGFVSGYRAGEDAGKLSASSAAGEIRAGQAEALINEALAPLQRDQGPHSDQVYMALNKMIIPLPYSFFKHENRIGTTLAEIARVQEEDLTQVSARDVHELVKANEARNYACLTEVIYRCALERKESRLGHYREEYPYRDDSDWLKWIIARRDRDGLALRFEPVPMEQYPIKPEIRTHIPPPVKFS